MAKKKKKSKTNIPIPKESFLNSAQISEDAACRLFPSIDILSKGRLKIVKDRTASLVSLLGEAGNPKRVSAYLANELTEYDGFNERSIFDNEFESEEKEYFFKDPWIKSGMIMVKEGTKPITDGFNLILAHTDSPCLRIKPRPFRIEDQNPYNFLGVRLSAIPHGGIMNYQWMGQQVRIVGDRFVNNKRFPVEFYGVVADASAHVNVKEDQEMDEAFSSERSLEIILGDMDISETLNTLGFKSLDDFAQSELYAVPVNTPLLMGGDNGRLLVAYGQDDLSCVHAAKDAITQADPKLTSIVWLSDKEESGESYPTGAEGPFMDRVLDYVIEKQERERGVQFSQRQKNMIYLKSSGIIADVNIAPYGHDADEMDSRNAPKIGLGVFIASGQGEISDARFVDDLRKMSRRGASKNNNLFHQVCGNFYSQDMFNLWAYDAPNKVMGKMGRWAWAGIPCASAHTHNEIICPGDEYWTNRFYKRFLESDLGLKKI